jgi:acyl-coenzyme A synthetase/AMP-(fatty) acid ligase
MFACWHAGLVAVPINAKLHPKELEFILPTAARASASPPPTSTPRSPRFGSPALRR